MKAYGQCVAGGATNLRGLPIPIEPIRSGRDPFVDLERAHTPQFRIPTVPTPRPERHAPTPARPALEEDPMPAHPLDHVPGYIVDFALLMAATENHPDSTVRVARKAVANAAVQLRRIHRDYEAEQRPPAASEPVEQQAKGWSRKKIHPSVIAAITRLSLEGLTTAQIADRLDISAATVNRYRRGERAA